MSNHAPSVALIVGSGRSGTTILYQTLCSALETAYISSIGGQYPRLAVPTGLLSRIARVRGLGPSNEAVAFLDRYGLGHSAVRDRARPLTADDVDQALASDFRTALARCAKVQGHTGLLLKNTGATARIEAIAHAAPTLKFVHIVRDGRAVAASLSRVGFFPNLYLWWAGCTAEALVGEYGSLEKVAIEHWARQVSAARSSLNTVKPPNRWITVSYEDLVTEPSETLARVHSFLGPELFPLRDGQTLDATDIRANSLDRWKDQICAADQSEMLTRHGQLLADLGY